LPGQQSQNKYQCNGFSHSLKSLGLSIAFLLFTQYFF
jgi:hypothetical protein